MIKYPSSAYNNLFSIFPFVLSVPLASERWFFLLFSGISSYVNRELGHRLFLLSRLILAGTLERYSALHLQHGGSNTGGYSFFGFHFPFLPQEETQQCTFLSAKTETETGLSNFSFLFLVFSVSGRQKWHKEAILERYPSCASGFDRPRDAPASSSPNCSRQFGLGFSVLRMKSRPFTTNIPRNELLRRPFSTRITFST